MTKIKITSKTTDAEKIESELEAKLQQVNGRATKHMMSVEDVIEAVEGAEEDLRNRGVTLKNLTGTVFTFAPRKDFPKSYDNAFQTTQITARRAGDGWRLVSAEKLQRWPGQSGVYDFVVSEAAEAEILKTAKANLRVREAA